MESPAPGSTIIRDDCPVCGGATKRIGFRRSEYSGDEFALLRCADCQYTFVRNPRTDFADLYDAEYYAGRGADALVDYEAEMTDPRTVRIYEWRGITRIVGRLVNLDSGTRWLDYGCGLGGLVRHVDEHEGCSIFGFEEGYAADRMAVGGVPHVGKAELPALASSFDAITAIEMIEHTLDPVAVLREIHGLLKPGGVLFLTTGNAEPHRRDLTRWSYTAVPDVHIGFFEPATLARALEIAGFEVLWPGKVDGLDDVIRFKVLKTLHVRRTSAVERLLPWRAITKLVDRRHQVSAMPAGRRPS